MRRVPSSAERVTFTVAADEAGRRLDQVLAARVPGLSRRQARVLLDIGGVFVDGRRMKVAGRPGARRRRDRRRARRGAGARHQAPRARRAHRGREPAAGLRRRLRGRRHRGGRQAAGPADGAHAGERPQQPERPAQPSRRRTAADLRRPPHRPRDQRPPGARQDRPREPRAQRRASGSTISSVDTWPSSPGLSPTRFGQSTRPSTDAAPSRTWRFGNVLATGRRCSVAVSRRAARTRSACTSRGWGTRCSAIRVMGRPVPLSVCRRRHASPCTRRGWPSPIPATDGPSPSTARCQRTSADWVARLRQP